MTVAPELFDQKRALSALKLADEVLRGPLGMKTLDPLDLQYRPNYDNSNDSKDPSIAKGLNYHNVFHIFRCTLLSVDHYFRARNGDGHWATFYVHIFIFQ